MDHSLRRHPSRSTSAPELAHTVATELYHANTRGTGHEVDQKENVDKGKSKEGKRVGFKGKDGVLDFDSHEHDLSQGAGTGLSLHATPKVMSEDPTHDFSMLAHSEFQGNRSSLRQGPSNQQNTVHRGEQSISDERFEIRKGYSPWEVEEDGQKARSAMEAQANAIKLAKRVEGYSSPSRPPTTPRHSFLFSGSTGRPKDMTEEIQLETMGERNFADQDADETDEDILMLSRQRRAYSTSEAHNIVRCDSGGRFGLQDPELALQSGQVTPVAEYPEDYVPRPRQYRRGILAMLLKLHASSAEEDDREAQSTHETRRKRPNSGLPDSEFTTPGSTPQRSPPLSGANTPDGFSSRNHRGKESNNSTSSLTKLLGSSSRLTSLGQPAIGEAVSERFRQLHNARKQSKGSRTIQNALGKISRQRVENEARITVHIVETELRQRYLLKLCKALMQFGAPTHRLEEYLTMSSRVLEVNAQFLYIPGCMIVSFEDSLSSTTDMRLIRASQGVDLGKLRDTHEVYKAVVHDRVSVDDATTQLKNIMDRKPHFPLWMLVVAYGLASVTVGPFAFRARPIDLPISFFLGTIVGGLQLLVATRSDGYSRVFEITASVITSFLARLLGSVRGGELFCFSALAQSGIVMILPGYTVLCSSLELQSRSIIAGSVRMVYAIIYSLLIGFGITIGTALYGAINKTATSETSCKNPMPEYLNFLFVPAFTLCLIVINKGQLKQVPVMMVLSFGGYVVTFFSSQHFKGNAQVSNTLGALAIGIMANLYSRLGQRIEDAAWAMWVKLESTTWLQPFRRRSGHPEARSTRDTQQQPGRRTGYGVAAAAMLPAIFVQVPSGLSVSGSLVSGITSADQIVNNRNGTTVVSSGDEVTGATNTIAFTVGLSVVQIAIGITVGLFLSALLVYPFGKRRSGLFSF